MHSKLYPQTFLNIAGGKHIPEEILQTEGEYFAVHLDRSYHEYICKSQGFIESLYLNEKMFDIHCRQKDNFDNYCNEDIFEYLGSNLIPFDKVFVYRFLEHIHRDEILTFIYLLSTVTSPGDEVEVIVPNMNDLFKLHEKLDVESKDFQNDYITLTTELFNEPMDPHKSMWIPDLVKYFWTLEKRFMITQLKESFEFDGRDIYMKFIAERI